MILLYIQIQNKWFESATRDQKSSQRKTRLSTSDYKFNKMNFCGARNSFRMRFRGLGTWQIQLYSSTFLAILSLLIFLVSGTSMTQFTECPRNLAQYVYSLYSNKLDYLRTCCINIYTEPYKDRGGGGMESPPRLPKVFCPLLKNLHTTKFLDFS